jgi:hypothetical protein
MTYDHWKATNPEDDVLGPEPIDKTNELLDHLDELAQKAETGADWAEIALLEAQIKGGPFYPGPLAVGDLLKAAYEADDAFALAIKAAGYKSRWDWNQAQDSRPMAAYVTKVLADEAMYKAFGTTS